jgi:hypothetical protein
MQVSLLVGRVTVLHITTEQRTNAFYIQSPRLQNARDTLQRTCDTDFRSMSCPRIRYARAIHIISELSSCSSPPLKSPNT